MDREFTGRARFRKGYKGVLVLQVQYKYWHYSYMDVEQCLAWADCTIELYTMLNLDLSVALKGS